MVDKKVKILSIDGGGIRGIIPAMILAEMEKETGKQIFEMFDLIAGTSTGGILALGLTVPDPDQLGKAKYKAEDLVKIYEGREGQLIFQSPHKSDIQMFADQILQQLQSSFHLPKGNIIEDLFRPKYPSDGREQVLVEKFGTTPIVNAVKEVFITSYDTERRKPTFFTSNPLREKKDKKDEKGKIPSFNNLCTGITMKDAAMATSAAPTYFPAYKINEPDTSIVPQGYYSLVDGGLFANNPTSLAIMEAIITYNDQHKEDQDEKNRKIGLDDVLVVSLGTGSLTRPYKYDDVKNWGQIKWALPALDVVFDGQSESVACQLEQLLPEAESIPKQYYRFQADLTNSNDNIDDASPENTSHLKELAQEILRDKKATKDWKEMCNQLLK